MVALFLLTKEILHSYKAAPFKA